MLSRCEWLECAAGYPIYHATDAHADPFGIADGSVEIYSRLGAGDNPLLHLLHEGSWIGHGSFMSGQRPRATVVARVDTLLARAPRRALQELLALHPEWWRILASAALEYGDMGISAYADTLISNNDRRCACTLLRIAGLQYPRRSRPDSAEVPVTQDEQGYRTLRVIDASGLQAFASGP